MVSASVQEFSVIESAPDIITSGRYWNHNLDDKISYGYNRTELDVTELISKYNSRVNGSSPSRNYYSIFIEFKDPTEFSEGGIKGLPQIVKDAFRQLFIENNYNEYTVYLKNFTITYADRLPIYISCLIDNHSRLEILDRDLFQVPVNTILKVLDIPVSPSCHFYFFKPVDGQDNTKLNLYLFTNLSLESYARCLMEDIPDNDPIGKYREIGII